ncbi:acyltransferase [Conexibacter sp. SYSU D00693]|uniref:acyltransferase family protein n=1 Tax=Conexibacter sp. SYSU D00693 TaxID=2812560 RepID=UPI00196B8804|nr:acyltransferase [Conexibacter sp. SYSU D00693]
MSRPRDAALDGLRAVAALAVLAYHAWLYSLPRVTASTRETTVDAVAHELRLGLVLFFVLTGYLLFGPWVRAAMDGGVAGPSVRRYARRRAARILPAYWLALAGSIALLWPREGTPGVRLPPEDDLWLFVVLGQDFKTSTLLKLDPPMWTLTVEATFYVLLPLLGAGALWLARGRLRGAPAAGPVAVAVALLVGGVAWNWWTSDRDLPPTVTKVLPAMAPYFAVGMLAAVAVRGRRLDGRAVGVLVALGALLVAGNGWWAYREALEGSTAIELRIVRDLPAAIGFALVVGAVAAAAQVPRGLGSRPLAWTGKVSYGLYLWHVPVLLVARAEGLLPASAFGAFAVALPPSLAVAAVSWYLVERPAMAWARGPQPSAGAAGSGSRQRAWASRPAMTVPVPSHQGQGTVDAEPPRFDTT